MKLTLSVILCSLLITTGQANAQSATTELLHKKHADALTLYFYKNTLRMLNQTEDKELDELIKDVEKMRFLLINKANTGFGADDYKELVSDYKSEQFEAIMTSRHDGKKFDVYLKQQDGKTKGMLVLVNDADNLYVLDILGRIALNKVVTFYDKLDESSDIGAKIRQFTGAGDAKDKNKK